MVKIKSVIISYDLVTAYGQGLLPCWEGILNKRSAINNFDRFCTKAFSCRQAAVIPQLEYLSNNSLVMQMLSGLLLKNKTLIPQDTLLILATTVGEIDLLEKQILRKTKHGLTGKLDCFLKKVKALISNKSKGMVVSCACASSNAAIGLAAGLINDSQHDCVLVVSADAVTEFIFSGFSSLMALDPGRAKPFDKNRAGLSLGEGAGFILLMSEKRAKNENRKIIGQIAGWAISADANHMTGPARNGSGLSQAISNALTQANVTADDIGAICAHGTGTVYNDSMEMKAYHNIFNNKPVPLYSLKGGLGHTMAAAGLIETIVALKVLQEKIIPPTVGLNNIDPEAKNWVSFEKRELNKSTLLLNNAGFGGVNAALIIRG